MVAISEKSLNIVDMDLGISASSELDVDFNRNHQNLDLCVDPTPEGHEALVTRLSSSVDPCERTFAAMSLGYLDDPKVAVPALEMAILTPNENIFVLEASLRSIANSGEAAKHSAHSVARLMNHDSAIVRVAASKALSAMNIDPELALVTLGSRLTDPSLGVRKEVAKAVVNLPEEQLTQLVPKAIHLLEIGEGDKGLVVDLFSIIERGGKGFAESSFAARERLKDSEPEVRLAAAKALAKLGNHAEVACPDLLKISTNPLEQRSLRKASIECVRQHGYFDPEHLMDLGRVVEEEILENIPTKIKEALNLKRDVIELLGEYGPKAVKVAPSLRDALQSGEIVLIVAAAETLSKIEAFEILIDALNSTDILVMQAIADAIKSLVHKLRPSKRAKLVALLKLKLGWIKEPTLIDSIMALLQSLEKCEEAEVIINDVRQTVLDNNINWA
ncbi:MAG: hypothetical protein SGJ02_08185 [bacterium]|nr:hypothetical protein [bacterium]